MYGWLVGRDWMGANSEQSLLAASVGMVDDKSFVGRTRADICWYNGRCARQRGSLLLPTKRVMPEPNAGRQQQAGKPVRGVVLAGQSRGIASVI